VVSANGGRSRDRPAAELSSADLFTRIWEALADVLGTAAAATLLRRAARRAQTRHPELAEFVVVRENLEYRYTLPSAWNDRTEGTQHALRHLVGELLPLLVELTGSLVVTHLAQVPELRERGIIPPDGTSPALPGRGQNSDGTSAAPPRRGRNTDEGP
jgi:nucleotide-binding universal stress UspA family protein